MRRQSAAGPEVPVLVDADRFAVREGSRAQSDGRVCEGDSVAIDYDRGLVETVQSVDLDRDRILVEAAAEVVESVGSWDRRDQQ